MSPDPRTLAAAEQARALLQIPFSPRATVRFGNP